LFHDRDAVFSLLINAMMQGFSVLSGTIEMLGLSDSNQPEALAQNFE
jgi:hypothetical protein